MNDMSIAVRSSFIFKLDETDHKLYLNGKDLHLRKAEFGAFATLIRAGGRLVQFSDIYCGINRNYKKHSCELFPSSSHSMEHSMRSNVRSTIKRAREKIRRVEALCDPIESEQGVGYRWISTVEMLPEKLMFDEQFSIGMGVEPGMYQHYKGERYHVLGVAEGGAHTLSVVYISQSGQNAGRLFLLPLHTFSIEISEPEYNGPQFKFLRAVGFL